MYGECEPSARGDVVAAVIREIRHAHLFCGLGGGARGFQAGHARVGTLAARFRCLGGIDSNPAACRDFERLTDAPATCLDLFDREQYRDWHGHEPPADWREATPDDVRRAFGNEVPHILFTSPPCKGFSGLLSQRRSDSNRYQALNRLTLRGLWLALEAWADDPPEFVLLENVPRIQQRGRHLLDQITDLLARYGYAVAETTHDCGELGGLAQRRRRFLLVARHQAKVPPFLYEPRTQRLRGVGEVLEQLPLPGDPAAGAMHQLARLQWRTWVRLAFVEAGKDWRSLRRLEVVDGMLRDYGIAASDPGGFGGWLGVNPWNAPMCTVTSTARPQNGAFAVADPRYPGSGDFGQLGVQPWNGVANAVSGQSLPGGGRYSVADPRVGGLRHNNVYRVVRWDEIAQAVTGGGGPSAGGQAVADPRPTFSDNAHRNKFAVTPWDTRAGAITSSTRPASGALCVADPRPNLANRPGRYGTAGHYGVVPWDSSTLAVTGSACHDNGFNSVADPRVQSAPAAPCDALPALTERVDACIIAEDGTWHRPFSTLELAALQGLYDPERDGPALDLDGTSDSAWRERIGNAVPPAAAAAVAGVMARTLLLAWSGETFALDAMPVWVRPIAIAVAVRTPTRANA